MGDVTEEAGSWRKYIITQWRREKTFQAEESAACKCVSYLGTMSHSAKREGSSSSGYKAVLGRVGKRLAMSCSCVSGAHSYLPAVFTGIF